VKRSSRDEPMWVVTLMCMEGSITRNLSVKLSSSQASKNAMFFLIIFYVFSSTKSENKRVEQILHGSEVGKKWPK
jgi:hypothetical protein